MPLSVPIQIAPAMIAAADGLGSPWNQRFVGDTDLRVESRQAQCRRRGIDECRQPAELTETGERPFVSDQRWSHTKRHHVREAVILGTKVALGVGDARNATVEAIQHHGGKDAEGGGLKLARIRRQDRVESGEQRGRGEQIWQQIDAATPFGRTRRVRRIIGVGHWGQTRGRP